MIKHVIALASLLGLIAGQAAAADLAAVPYAQVATVAPRTGFHVGVAGGWGRGTSRHEQTNFTFGGGFGDSGDFGQTGWIAGATVGYDWQFGSFVVGVEGDLSAADIDGNTSKGGCAGPIPCRTRITWLHTGRGRVGVAFGQFMPYITGGIAFAGLKANNSVAENSQTDGVRGAVVGGGLEWMFLPQWSAKAEYLFIPSFTTTTPSDLYGTLTERNVSLVRFGVNYHFGSDGPVTARY
ncbi:outer membrane protein [Bradyrhizobium sp. UFLA05-112]